MNVPAQGDRHRIGHSTNYVMHVSFAFLDQSLTPSLIYTWFTVTLPNAVFALPAFEYWFLSGNYAIILSIKSYAYLLHSLVLLSCDVSAAIDNGLWHLILPVD